MAEARRRRASLSDPTWIVARRQTAGVGRRGRAWRDPAGNYAGTLVMRVEGGAPAMALRSFVAALAVHDAATATGADGLALKWPNDVLRHGAKLAGILLESLDRETVAVGIGVNLSEAPAADEVEAGALLPAFLDARMTPEAFHALLAPAFEARDANLRAQGFGTTRDAWLARAAGLGAPIRARLLHEELRGTFDGIDGAGHLILRTPRGVRHLPAADVTL